MTNVEELERALDFPWEKWSVFLHPTQRELVERDYGGPARVAGSAGTGKTIVALHRAVHLARSNPGSRVLLATFSEPLAAALRVKLQRLVGNEPRLRERLEVEATPTVASRIYEARFGKPNLVPDETIKSWLKEQAARHEGQRFSAHFLWTEWSSVVDAWQLETWEEYRDVQRLGRKTRLAETQRALLWSIFESVRERLAGVGLLTEPGLLGEVERHLATSGRSPFDFAVVDEAQDLGVPELRFIATLGAGRPNALFFAGDLGQRIFQAPFSWLSLGVDVRGRSHTLRINYRTSHQIRRQADRLLPPELADVDGTSENRRGTISVFNGPEPEVRVLDSPEEEERVVAEWLSTRVEEGFAPDEIGLFVRSEAEMERAKAAVRAAGLNWAELGGKAGGGAGAVAIGTMHLAKGLEFRAVAVAACDDEVLPLQARIEAVADAADLEDVYNTERHLLYVACTRARDRLLVTGVDPASEFLEDLRQGSDPRETGITFSPLG
jgi:superfamily I DNA/RNA helicase